MVEEILKQNFKIIGVYTNNFEIPSFDGDIEELIPFKTSDALKITQLDANCLNNLSTKNISKLQLATQLNKDVIILYDFSRGLNYKEIKYFNLFFKKITKNYNKKIIIISKDVNYLFLICDTIAVYKKKIVYITNDFFDIQLYNYMDMPNIIKFIKFANKKNANISCTTDINLLTKDICWRKHEN